MFSTSSICFTTETVEMSVNVGKHEDLASKQREVEVFELTEAGGVGCRVDLQSGATDDQIGGQRFSFIRLHLGVLLGHIQLQL